MMSLFSNLFVVTLFVCMSVKYGSCLNCYVCDDLGPAITFHGGIGSSSVCKDVDSSMIRSCPDSDDDTVCRTLRADVERLPHGEHTTAVKRSCGKLQFEDLKKAGEANDKPWFFLKDVAVSSMVCNTDLCNAAVDITSTKLILFISAVLSLSFFMNVYY